MDGLFGPNILTSSQLACQFSQQTAAPVSQRSWVQIPYGPEFFSGPIFNYSFQQCSQLRGSLTFVSSPQCKYMNFIYLKSLKAHELRIFFNRVQFLYRMHWKAYFFFNPDTTTRSKDTYNFKSTKNPPRIDQLKEFEDDMLKMIFTKRFQTFRLNSFLVILNSFFFRFQSIFVQIKVIYFFFQKRENQTF